MKYEETKRRPQKSQEPEQDRYPKAAQMKYVGALGKTMALSLSSRFPSLFTLSPLKNPFSSFPIRQYRILFVLDPSKNNNTTRNKLLRRRNSFCTPASAALQEAPAPTEKIVLPTNESSDGLLRIRHTVMLIFGWVYGYCRN